MARNVHRPHGEVIKQRREAQGYHTREAAVAALEASFPEHIISESTWRDLEQNKNASQKSLEAVALLLGGHWHDYLDPTAPENTDALQAVQLATRYTLLGSMPLLLGWEIHLGHDQPLQVDTLAIDLADGWRMIYEALSATASEVIHLRVLMLTGDPTRLLEDAPTIVRNWAVAAQLNLELFRQQLESCTQIPGKQRVDVEIRTYNATPTYHGVRLQKGSEQRYTTSCCRWLEGAFLAYDYCGHEYVIFDEKPQPQDIENYRRAYDARFAELWNKGANSIVLLHSIVANDAAVIA